MKPYYEHGGITIYHAPCLDVLPELEHYDVCITSPPYNLNTRVNTKRQYVSRQITGEFSTKYSGYADNLHPDQYFQEMRQVLGECISLCDMVFWNIQIATGNKPALFRLMGEFADHIKEMAIWDKGYGQPAMKTQTMNSVYEMIWVLCNQDPQTRQFGAATFDRGSMDNIWRIDRERSISPDHGATFPPALVSQCLSIHDGNTIVDPFMGSGTTLRVAKSLGKKATGIEIDEKYCEIAANSLSQEVLKFE